MAKNKDVWARKWQIFASGGDGWKYLKPGIFRLKAVHDRKHPKQVAFYRVTVLKGMHICWKKIRLFPRGSECSSINGDPLPVWDSNCDQRWNDAANDLRESYGMPDGSIPSINPRLERLEGDIRPNKKYAEALTIVRVEAAVEDQTDLLVLMIKSCPIKSRRKMKMLEDGTAHGGNPH